MQIKIPKSKIVASKNHRHLLANGAILCEGDYPYIDHAIIKRFKLTVLKDRQHHLSKALLELNMTSKLMVSNVSKAPAHYNADILVTVYDVSGTDYDFTLLNEESICKYCTAMAQVNFEEWDL